MRTRPSRYARLIPLLLAAAVLLSGCDDDPVLPDPCADRDGILLPASPADVMANFRHAYEAMDVAALRAVLHPQHVTRLHPVTAAQYPDLGTELDMTEEMRIAERMFSGEDVTNSDQVLVPGLTGILFREFEQNSGWVSPPIPDFAGELSSAFDVEVLVDRGESNSLIMVVGQILFSVVPRDSTDACGTYTYYQITSQADLTSRKKVRTTASVEETTPWGSAKAMFH